MFYMWFVVQCQYDGVDYGNQQDEVGCLEEIYIVVVQDYVECFDIGDIVWYYCCVQSFGLFGCVLGQVDYGQFDGQDQGDDGIEWCVFQEILFQFGEIDVEYYDDEEEEYCDCVDIDNDQQYGEEFCVQQYEKICC